MKIIGLDYSMNSPGVVSFQLDNELNLINADCLGFTTVKKNTNQNILFYKKDLFQSNIEKFIYINSKIEEFITKTNTKTDYIAIEGYAYGAHGHVFEIGEATGDIKRRIFQQKIPLRIYDPTSIKMFTTDSGTSDKEEMKKHYKGILPIDQINEDIIDAYHIASLLQMELKIRHGLVKTSELPEKQIQVFNRCTKSNPTNLLDRDFILKKD